MNAREIAEHIKASRPTTFEEASRVLAPLREHAKNLYASGAPTLLHEAISGAVTETMEAQRRLHDKIAENVKNGEQALVMVDAGNLVYGSLLSEQTNHSAVLLSEVVRAKRDALLVLLDVFAAVGDRIEATPEERDAAAKRDAERAAAKKMALVSRWGKKNTATIVDAANAYGIPLDKRAAMIEALAEKGVEPNA
jgi:hypothetical protein